MSFFLFKSILALFFLITALIALLSMLTSVGKTEKKTSPDTLRKIHKISGFLFFILLLVISYFCLKYWVKVGDQASIRATFHAVLAFALIIIFILKIMIVQFYKQFLRFAPVLGMLVFCFAFVIFSTSAGFYLLRSVCSSPTPLVESSQPAASSAITGNAERGAILYGEKCSSCHYADREHPRLGPGLKALFKKETLPHSGRPATAENVREQLLRPILTMPSFSRLPEQDIADLLEYLKTL
jgi:mono/diheme cytochrome c family protein